MGRRNQEVMVLKLAPPNWESRAISERELELLKKDLKK